MFNNKRLYNYIYILIIYTIFQTSNFLKSTYHIDNSINNLEDKDIYDIIDENNVNKLNSLLKNPNIDINKSNYLKKKPNLEQTPLMYAIETDKIDIINALLKHQNINVNQTDYFDRTPLLYAMDLWGRLLYGIPSNINNRIKIDIINALLNHPDIDVNKSDKYGTTPLIEAIKINNIIRNNIIRNKIIRNKIKINNIIRNNIDIINNLLKHPNIDVNQSDNYGKTPLIEAIETKNIDIINALLNHPDIDVNKSDKYGITPLIDAIETKNIDIISALLKNPNIDVNKSDNYGKTPLTVAIEILDKDSDIIKLILLIKSIKLYDNSSKLEFNENEFNFENSSSIKDIEEFKNNLKDLINNINNNDTNYIDKLIKEENKDKAKIFTMLLFIDKFFDFIVNNSNYNKIKLFIDNIKTNNINIDKSYIEKIEEKIL